MRILFLTYYETQKASGYNIFPNTSNRIKLTSGFQFIQHNYKDKTHLFYQHTQDDFKKIKEEISKHDIVFASFLLKSHFRFLEPLIDGKWVIGGPYVEQSNEVLSVHATQCHTNYEFFIGKKELCSDFEPYWYDFLDSLPNIDFVRGVISLGIGCYWGKCIFCDFDIAACPKLQLRTDIYKIFSKIQKKPYSQWYHLATESLIPSQIHTLAPMLPEIFNKDCILHSYLRIDDGNVSALEKYDDLRGLGLTLGIEVLSQQGMDIIQKGFKIEQLKRICDLTHKGLSLQINLIHNWNFFNEDMYNEAMYYISEVDKRCKRVHENQYLFYKHEEICVWYPNNSNADRLLKKYGGKLVYREPEYDHNKRNIIRYQDAFNIWPVGKNKIYCEKLLAHFGLPPSGFDREVTYIG